MEARQLYAGGEPIVPELSAGETSADDTHGLAGGGATTVQRLLDELADRVAHRLLEKAAVAAWALRETKPEYTAGEVGADAAGSARDALAAAREYSDATYIQATGYTDMQVAALVNGAPETMDTLKEIADAMAENADVVEALQAAIGSRASDAEVQAHKSNGTVHITKSERDAWNAAKEKVNGLDDKKQDKATAINESNIGSQSVSYAGNAGNADTVDGKHFHWSGQSGQPNWLWGCDDGGNSYVWNPSNFNVNHARSAGDADTAANCPNCLPLSGGSVTGTVRMHNASLILTEGYDLYFGQDYGNRPSIGAGYRMLEIQSGIPDIGLRFGVLNATWTLCPTDAYTTLGIPAYRWGQIYSSVASISTSDRREKTDIEEIDYDGIKEFLKDLKPVYYRLVKHPEKKYAGLIAQEVEQAMVKHNIPADFGLLDKCPDYDDEGNETGDYVYGLCYEQLITLMLLVLQNDVLGD